MKVNYKNCKKILSIDFDTIDNISKLQEYKVNLIDSYKYINNFSELGLTTDSINRNFIIQVPEISLNSFVPKDKFMTSNINYAIKKINERIKDLYIKDIRKNNSNFESDIYKGIYYSVMNDCDENRGGYYVEFFKVINENTQDIDFDNRLDYMVIHIDNEYEMKHSKELVEEYIDSFLIKQENENLEDEL